MKPAQRRALMRHQAATLAALLAGSRDFGPAQHEIFLAARRKYIDLLVTGLRASFPFFMKHSKYSPRQLFERFQGRGVNLDELERVELAFRLLKPGLSPARLDLLSLDRAMTRLRRGRPRGVEIVRLRTNVLDSYPDFQPRRVRNLARPTRVALRLHGNELVIKPAAGTDSPTNAARTRQPVSP